MVEIDWVCGVDVLPVLLELGYLVVESIEFCMESRLQCTHLGFMLIDKCVHGGCKFQLVAFEHPRRGVCVHGVGFLVDALGRVMAIMIIVMIAHDCGHVGVPGVYGGSDFIDTRV